MMAIIVVNNESLLQIGPASMNAIAFRSSNRSWKRRARNILNKDGQASFMSDVIPYKRKFRGSSYRIFEAN